MGAAAPVVVAVVAVAASVVAGPEMGAAILGYGDSIEAVAAGYSVSTLSAVGAAASGAASGAITEAQKSGDPTKILEAAGIGAVSGAVGSEVGGAVGSETGSPILGSTAGGATSGFTKAELSGSNLQNATRQAEIGGTTAGLTQGIFGTTDGSTSTESDRLARALGGAFIGQNVSNLFAPTQTAQAGQAQAPGQPPFSTLTTGQPGTTPGSAALAQSLNLGGGDISPPVNIGGGEKDTRNVWNIASLRTKDETGS
jgi:hypothetical protein